MVGAPIRRTLALFGLMVAACAAGCAQGGKDDVAETIAWAKAIRPLVQDAAVIQQQRVYRERQDLAFERQLNRAEEAKVPYDGVMHYPGNWPGISAKRDGQQSRRNLPAGAP